MRSSGSKSSQKKMNEGVGYQDKNWELIDPYGQIRERGVFPNKVSGVRIFFSSWAVTKR